MNNILKLNDYRPQLEFEATPEIEAIINLYKTIHDCDDDTAVNALILLGLKANGFTPTP